jgi:hypothetical protein
MKFIEDEKGQGAAEYILLFGGVIIVAIASLILYRNYIKAGTNPFNVPSDMNTVRGSL